MNAHDAVLTWCRKDTHKGLPCMRERPPNWVAKGSPKCVVVDNSTFGGSLMVEGATWEAVAQALELSYE